jgi:hypothetical protein
MISAIDAVAVSPVRNQVMIDHTVMCWDVCWDMCWDIRGYQVQIEPEAALESRRIKGLEVEVC